MSYFKAQQAGKIGPRTIHSFPDSTSLLSQNAGQVTYERFYHNLALFSGGTIALSVTYLGYLKTLAKPVVHQSLLVESWGALFLCLLFSLIYIFCNLRYGH